MVAVNLYPLDNFIQFDSAYWGLSTDSEDDLYFGLCTHQPSCSAGFFRFEIASKSTELLFTLDQVIETQSGYLPQSKIHTNIYRGDDDNLYFGTHFAYPNCIPQSIQYEGGHIICYTPKTGSIIDHGILVENEGIVTLLLDKSRMHCYAVTSPSFYFVDYDISHRTIVSRTRITDSGSICRSLGLDGDGNVYGCCEPYRVFRYCFSTKHVEFLSTNLGAVTKKTNEWDSPNKRGANRVGRSLWRCIEYEPTQNVFYGINASDSSLFKFNTVENSFSRIAETTVWDINRIYPSLTFMRCGNTYYYSPSNGKFDYKLSEDIESTCALVSFDVHSQLLRQHGLLTGPNGEVIYGCASAMGTAAGNLYFLGATSFDNVENKSAHLSFGNTRFRLSLIELDYRTLYSEA